MGLWDSNMRANRFNPECTKSNKYFLLLPPSQNDSEEKNYDKGKWAMPYLFSTWKVQINGIKEEHYAILYNLNPKLKKKIVQGFITAKWKVPGAGGGCFPPMSSITPIINIMEDWGYQLQSCCSVGSDSSDTKIGKLWILRKKDCFRMMLPPQMP